MSAMYTWVQAETKQAVEIKAKEKIDELGVMRQPMCESISFCHPIDGNPHWVAKIKYWGLD